MRGVKMGIIWFFSVREVLRARIPLDWFVFSTCLSQTPNFMEIKRIASF